MREETCAAAMAAFLWAMEEGEDEEGEDEEAEEEGGGCFGSTTSTTPVVRTMMEREGRERAPDASRAETEMANSQPEGRRVRMWRVADVVSSPSMSVPWSDQERAYSTAPGRWDQAREREDAFVSTRVRPSTAWSPEKRMEEEEEEGGMGAEGEEGEGGEERAEERLERRYCALQEEGERWGGAGVVFGTRGGETSRAREDRVASSRRSWRASATSWGMGRVVKRRGGDGGERTPISLMAATVTEYCVSG